MMNTITETKLDPAMREIARAKDKQTLKKELTTYDAHFLNDKMLDQCLCTVPSGLPIWNVSNKLQSIIATCITSLELIEGNHLNRKDETIKDPVIPLSQLRLLTNSLELAVGMAGSIWAGADVFDDDLNVN